MKSCEFAQIGFLHPILSKLQSHGVNLSPYIQNAGIEIFDLQNPETYIPLHLYEKFLNQISRKQGIANIANEFHSQIHLGSCSEFGELISGQTSLLNVCQKAVKFPNVVFTNERLRFTTHGRISKLEQWFVNFDEKRTSQLTGIDNAIMFNAFKLYLGEDWEPVELHYQNDTALDISKYFPNARKTRVRTGMPSTAIVFETDLLTRNSNGNDRLSSTPEPDFSIPASASDKIEILLTQTLPGMVPSIREAAEMLDTSERTLRRALAEESCTFAELVDDWRRKEALRKVNDNRVHIDDISASLGYLNPSAFFRAFKRWTNFTPNRYRDLDPERQALAMAS
ncbi:helix-turn-helix domain-containing protein [Pelagicoccus mobilis]|uniref:Helix-turn-helix transcriptional regulator n=1 Tax=Pelagicoccus mobilis TaxID=415221 RepID=A0A934S0W9_9BACT|nr:AraC family transcriptional regulator [Pelagicoccus mobilis]MBK1879150.1 helix-turn-helix transcriptional regulator [Pelagicoccus mobilis]